MDSRDEAAGAPAVETTGSRWAWRLALVLAMLAGGTAGFYLRGPVYRSEALLQLPPNAAGGLDAAVERDYVAGQAVFIGSRAMARHAIKSREWTALGRKMPPAAEAKFEERLRAEALPGGLIRVTFEDEDPAAAQAGVSAAAASYSEYATDRRLSDEMKRLKLLQDHIATLDGEVRRIDARILDVKKEWGAPDLEQLREGRVAEWLRLERALREAEVEAAAASGAAASRPATRPVVQVLRKQLEEAKAAAREVSRDAVELEELGKKREEKESERRDAAKRQDQIAMEAKLGRNGVLVLSRGDRPIAPWGNRRARAAAWGAVAGSVGFVVLWGVWRAWRGRRRVVAARTAFPVILRYSPGGGVSVSGGDGAEGGSGVDPAADVHLTARD